MEILADAGIAAVETAFSGFGRLRTFDGRSLGAGDLGDAEVLLVRSVTRVDAALLAGSAVRFVGTSTAGVDHVDTAWLAAQGIAFADAAGCNARAVAEHVVVCLHAFAAERGCDVRALRVGIVGYGHVGRAVGALLRALGVGYVVNDPPLGDVPGETFVPLAEALAADVVTLHVPLTERGPHATRDLVNAERVAALRPGTLLINAARGGVVDEHALAARADDGILAAIDCWDGEPDPGTMMLARAWRASPHIAGHSREARVAATRLLHRALAVHLGDDRAFTEPRDEDRQRIEGVSSVGAALEHVHSLALHTVRMRRMLALPKARRAAHFDDIRARYGLRREFAHYTVACGDPGPDTVGRLTALGFAVESRGSGGGAHP